MHPVEDRHLPEIGPLGLSAAYGVDDEPRLVALVAGQHHAHGLPLCVRRPQFLGLALARSGDYTESSSYDSLTRAVVLLQLDDRRVRVLAAETADVADIGATPAVD